MSNCRNISVGPATTECYLEIANTASFSLLLYLTLLLQIYIKCSNKRSGEGRLLSGHGRRSFLSLCMLLVHLGELGAAFAGDPSWIPAVSASLSWLPVQTFYATIQSVGSGEYLIATSCCYLLCGLTRGVLLHSLLERMNWSYVAPTLAAASSALSYAFFFNDLITVLYELKAERAPIDEYESYCYSRAGYFSRTCFFWLLPLLRSGFRCPLELPDLGAIPRSESLHYRLPIFLASYNRIKDSKRGSSFLWRSFFRCYWKQLLTSGLMKLAGDLVGMIPPLGIAVIIDYIQTQNDPSQGSKMVEFSTWSKVLTNGYVMAGTVLISSLTQASFSQMSSHILSVQGIRLKACLQGMVYSKVLRVGISRQEDESSLEGNVANLMSEDVANVFTCVSIGHYIWAIPLKIAVLLYLLYTKLGVSAVLGASCCIAFMTPLQFYLGKKMSSNSKLIASWCDERLQKTNEMLQDFRVLKLCCWEMRFSERICQTRKKELRLLDKDSLYWALMTFLTQTSSVLMIVVTLVVYFHMETVSLAPAVVFSALALFNQLTVPLVIFPVTVPIVITALNSIKRLEDFFRLSEVTNVIPDQACKGLKDRKLKIPSEDSMHTVNNGELEGKLNTSDFLHQDETDSNVVIIRKAKFSWSDESKPALTIDHLNIPASKLTVVIGKVGSGKSSLLSALLGEIKCTAGLMMWQKGIQVAYVSQNPWLLNATVRDNILLGLPYNQRRFSRVVIGAALQQDIANLPSRDLTNIGDRGVNLSGGQRQRIAIARALYSRANVLILDDPLSALDCNIAQQVFENGIKKLVTKHGKTVIMVTHSLHLLTNAHQIVALEGGKVKASGKLCDIEVVNGVMTEVQNSPSGRVKTARDRWHLIRLVSRIGHHIRQHSNNYKIKSVFVPLGKAVSGSKRWKQRYWELPLVDSSEDESTRRGLTMRLAVRKNNAVSRASSLQHKSPSSWHGVTRQASTPAINQINRVKTYTFEGNQGNQSGNLIRNIFNSSSRHFSSDLESKCETNFKEKSLIRRLIPSTSFRHSTKGEQHAVKRPVQRLPSTCSEYSDDFLDDEDDEEDDWYGSKCSDERQYGQISIDVYQKYVKCCGIVSSTGYLALATTWQILRVYSDFWLGEWTEVSSANLENQGLYYLTGYTVLSLITVIVSLLGSVLGQVCGAKARKKLHKDLLESVLRMPVIAFEAFPHARILARFSNDISIIDKKLASSVQRLVQFLLLCLPAIFVNSVITVWFLLIAIPICVMYYWIQKFYRSSSRELNRLESLSRTPILSHLNETVSGLEVIRAFKQQQRFTSTMYTKIDIHTNAVLISNSANRWLGIALDYLGSCIVGAAIVVCLLTTWLVPGVVTPALVGVAVNYTLLVPIYLNWVVKFFSEVETNMSAVERLQHYLQYPPEDYREKCIMYYGWPQKGEVRFDKVSIKYGIQCDSVIKKLELCIPSGQKVGLCGRTGSGKSSVIMSLFGVAPVVEGTIYIDDVDISRIPLCILRSRMSIIPQEVILYSGTIRENLDLCNHFTDAELWAALEVAQIKNMVISNLGGLDGMVREGGSNLSLGERQLLCLARAVLHNSAILVMDEATSCLDSTTEKTLLQVAYKAFHKKTVITIAHRLTTLLSCDRILVLESGQIVEDGSPDELLKKSMGIFSTMLRMSETPNVVSK